MHPRGSFTSTVDVRSGLSAALLRAPPGRAIPTVFGRRVACAPDLAQRQRVVGRHFAGLHRLQQRVVQFARDASALGQPLVESRTEGGGDGAL
jgi:hypothetical protein